MIKAESLLGVFCSNKRDFCVVLALPWTHVRHFPPYPNADHWDEAFDQKDSTLWSLIIERARDKKLNDKTSRAYLHLSLWGPEMRKACAAC